MARRFTVIDHFMESIFGQANAYSCDVCGFTTEKTVGPIHWFVWVIHDLTVGWSTKHWSGYEW